MGHSSVITRFRILAAAAAASVVGLEAARAQNPQGQSGPVYQRQAFEWQNGAGRWQGQGHDQGHSGGQHGGWPHKGGGGHFFRPQHSPSVQSSWFQRPYPYHLDFYKMKYGGSYAPYFGNLYGPPQVVTAPPYYGPYYGGFGYGSPEGYGQFGGYGGAPMGYPAGPNGAVFESPAVESTPSDEPIAKPNGESLPTPKP